MKTLINKVSFGVVALLFAGVSSAATVEIRPNGTCSNPGTSCDDTVLAGNFTIVIHGDGFPETAGATLGLLYDNTKVSYVSGALPATGPWTAAGGSFFLPHPGPGTPNAAPANPAATFDILAPSSGTPPSGSFDALVFTFNVIGVGYAGIQIIDNEDTLLWVDANTFEAIPTTYTQANVCVGQASCVAPPIPVPAALWLMLGGLGSLAGIGRIKRLRRQ